MPHTKLRRLVTISVAVTLGATALAACGSSDDDDSEADSGPVSLTYWSWTPGMDKVADLWNKGQGKKDQIKVTVKKQASGDDAGHQDPHRAQGQEGPGPGPGRVPGPADAGQQ